MEQTDRPDHLSVEIADLLDEYLATDPRDRDAFLQERCGSKDKLRAELLSLAAAHDAAGDFLSRPTQDLIPAPDGRSSAKSPRSLGEGPGDLIGRYKLLQLIGEGGFGVVFMAQQSEPIRRRVALKIIKLGMDTRQIIARFEAERQALAMMDHPNIAQVLDAGATDSGRPYFVMELVRGDPINEYCNRERLNTRERLELFLQVCYAVQHAHQKGIIHRDLKPSNILVTIADSRPLAKVIDFGIAKATNSELTEKTFFTEFRQFIGTPEYMSPEQADRSAMDIDTRSDIYSLGVLLYELLTGTKPYDVARLRTAGWGELQRIIREEEPPTPSTRVSTLGEQLTLVARQRSTEPKRLGSVLRGELDWIVMKAMEKDRSRRYPTAQSLAEDVQRYLNNEPVQACPPGIRYRLSKFLRKYRAVIAATVVILGLLAGGFTATSLALVWALRQRDRAVAAEAVAAEQAARAKRFVSIAGSALLRREEVVRFKEEWQKEVELRKQNLPPHSEERITEEVRFATWFGFACLMLNLQDLAPEALALQEELYPRAKRYLAPEDPTFASLALSRIQLIAYCDKPTGEDSLFALTPETARILKPLFEDLMHGLEQLWSSDDSVYQQVRLEQATINFRAGDSARAIEILEGYWQWHEKQSDSLSGSFAGLHRYRRQMLLQELAKRQEEFPEWYERFRSLD